MVWVQNDMTTVKLNNQNVQTNGTSIVIMDIAIMKLRT
jgi:hypothetical protein